MAVAEEQQQPPAESKPTKKRGGYFATVPPQEILPIVDGRYESSVKGIYVIGDVTGLPLVKVAANQGTDVVQKMEKDKRFLTTDADDERLDLVIIGGGPAGLAAAVECQKRGYKYVVLEQARLANTVRTFPEGKKVYAEPQNVTNKSEFDIDADLDRDDFLKKIEQEVEAKQIKFKEGVEVTQVKQTGDREFEVLTKDGKSFPTRQVLVAIGRQGQPKELNVPGAEKCHKVTYKLHTKNDYHDRDIIIVGGGNSAIEAALMLMDDNRVTLSYRGEDFFRAKSENRKLLEEAEQAGQLTILRESNLKEIREDEVDIEVKGQLRTIKNDQVIGQIGTLPPVDFLLDMGLELDGVWTAKRVFWSIVGIAVGIFIYFYAKKFTLIAAESSGKLLIPGLSGLNNATMKMGVDLIFGFLLPVAWLVGFAVCLIADQMKAKGKKPPVELPFASPLLTIGFFTYFIYLAFPYTFTVDPEAAGPGPYYLPGLEWIFAFIPDYFQNLYGFYYLLYFSGIAGFGLYWAIKQNNRFVWRRNLTIIVTQWTLWWGIPTFLAVFIGRNALTPVISKSLNAWPLKIDAFNAEPNVTVGDPYWWYIVAIVGVVWAVLLTFVFIPLFTIKFGKIYCSYICSCGALAETVGNSYRHRGPKGDFPRWVERLGYVFILWAVVATFGNFYPDAVIVPPNDALAWVNGNMLGYDHATGTIKGAQVFGNYQTIVGTFLAGSMAIGLYPFLGQRIWCRMWCPLAFWMNFWGRWSKFQIVPEKGKCIDCNVCNQYCQMGIDIKGRALRGEPVTLADTPCVGCAECVARCPMEILHLDKLPEQKLHQLEMPK